MGLKTTKKSKSSLSSSSSVVNNSKTVLSKPQQPKKLKQQIKKQNWSSRIEKNVVQNQKEKKKLQDKMNLIDFTDVLHELHENDGNLKTTTSAERNGSGKGKGNKSKSNSSASLLPQSRKGRSKLLFQEMQTFKKVVTHSAFTSNPLSVIQQHLANSIKANKI